MALLDCSTCGGILPAGRSCCPHCHCKSSAWKRWAIAATAVAGLGATDCGNTAVNPGGNVDLSMSKSTDMSIPEPAADYGPAIQLDMAQPDGDTHE